MPSAMLGVGAGSSSVRRPPPAAARSVPAIRSASARRRQDALEVGDAHVERDTEQHEGQDDVERDQRFRLKCSRTASSSFICPWARGACP